MDPQYVDPGDSTRPCVRDAWGSCGAVKPVPSRRSPGGLVHFPRVDCHDRLSVRPQAFAGKVTVGLRAGGVIDQIVR